MKIVIQDFMCKIDAFSRRNGLFIFPPKGGAQKRKLLTNTISASLILNASGELTRVINIMK